MAESFSTVICIHTVNTNPIPYAVARLREETEKAGKRFVAVLADDIVIAPNSAGTDQLWHNGVPLDLSDAAVIIRDLTRQGRYDPGLGVAMFRLFTQQSIPVFNGASWQKTGSLKDKLTQYLFLHNAGLPVIAPTLFFNNTKNLLSYPNWMWPIIRKPRTGSHGDGIIKVDSLDALAAAATDNPEQFIWQPYIDADFDLRIFTTQTEVIGAIKRQNDATVVNNVSAGGTASVFTVTDELQKLCLHAARALNADLLGLDIIIDRSTQKPYILELDRSNQFEGFEKATGINLAKWHLTQLEHASGSR